MSFGETVSPVAAIQAILHDYPYSASILRELLQNSDDAGAQKQIFLLEKENNPALIAYNDSEFQEPDWQAIQSIHQSSKKADTSKIGKYGVGFRACYHITDQPQILSGSFFAVLDPLHSNGMKIDYEKFRTTEYCKHFDFFSGMFKQGSFSGTAIRLPLRSSPSDLSQHVVRIDELQRMIADYISEEMNVSLLFLDKLKMIEIWETDNNLKTLLAVWTKSGATSLHQDATLPLVTYNTILSDGNTEYSWQTVQTQSSENEAISRLSQQFNDPVNSIVEKHKLRSDVRIAYPLTSEEPMSGRLFTFLPLPSKTDFPVHIHALFALTSSRQSLRNPNETGIVSGSDNDVLIKWNRLLFNHYIPQGWGYLLKTLAADPSCSDIFDAWPSYCSSITSGDGVYWQDILSRTFKIVVESGLRVWPKISAQGAMIYVDLKSSLIIAHGQVNADVLIVFAELGLLLVQLPQSLWDLVDESLTKLSPSIAHGKLQGALDRFPQLSANQRALACKYLLSASDISNIFGLPLIPVLDGSFVALGHRNETPQRFVAMTKEEARVFRTYASDAIPLDQLSPEMAGLIREQGTTQSNVDLLSPKHVIGYLSTGAQVLSDDWLIEFWHWVTDWHPKMELIHLLKTSALQLIPTTQGLQPLSSPVFNMMQDTVNSQLFGKLGLAFITSAFPASAVHLLLDHDVLKNAADLNHFLAAINLISMPFLTDDEAKLIFNHVTAYYGPVSVDNLLKLKQLPVFPVLVPSDEPHPRILSNSSVTWRSIHDITVKGISPMNLIPVADNVHFLSELKIRDTTSFILKKLNIQVLREEDVLLHALDLFTSQPKSLQAAFVSYIRFNQSQLPTVRQALQRKAFLRAADGSLQSPANVIDPGSSIANIFPQGCKDSRIPVKDHNYDQQLFDDLRTLGLIKTKLELDLVQERISYISSNSNFPEATAVARSLLALMNERSFSCFGLSIDPNASWLPTANGLATSKKCINSDRRDTDLFDEVLITLDESIHTSPSFKELLDWDKPLALEILATQLHHVLDSPSSEAQSCKIRNIIRELSSRQLTDKDVQVIQTSVNGRPWIPTKSGLLAQPSFAVFVNVEVSSGFHEVAFSKSDKEIHQFLIRMGCSDRPTAAVIIKELMALQEKSKEDGTVVQRAVLLLEMLPGFMTEEELTSLFVPDKLGYLVSLSSGICYYGGSGEVGADNGIPIAHHLVTERLAVKLRMNRLGLEAEDDIDLGGKPITTIRNTLKQYDPKQFFTEFIANASDAKAKKFCILIDDQEGPTDPKKLFSTGMTPFQSASLVVYNDRVFEQGDFKGIRDTGIGGKKGKSNMIGHFGLGALSMFHFTELAMIVSGGHVLFLNPAKHSLAYRDRNSVLLPLVQVKRLYRDHLEPLNGLFGFDLATEYYQGTIFRLPLRNRSHITNEAHAVSLETWSIKDVEDMLLRQFDDLAYKSLLFTGLVGIELLARRDSRLETLRSIEVARVPDDNTTEVPFESEIATFTTPNNQTKWLIVSKAVEIPNEFRKTLQERCNVLPVQIAATLDDTQSTSADRNLFCALPLPVPASLPVHISAPFILEQERRNIRLDNLGMESKYNQWLLSSEIPSLYLYLLEALLTIQGHNDAWWPPTSGNNSMTSQVFIDAFWTPKVLGTSSRRIFASRTKPPTPVAPKDAVLLVETHSFINTLSRILDISGPVNIVNLSGTSMEAASKAGLHLIDASFIKNLLQGPEVCQQLNVHEKNMALWFLYSYNTPPHGLPLLPLEDGSYATILSKSDTNRMYYVLEQASDASYPPFRKDRLVHRGFKKFLLDNGPREAWKRLLGDNNVSLLSDKGITELIKEAIQPIDDFAGDQAHEVWVDDFWGARLTEPQVVSQFPLVSTRKRFHFISLRKVDDPSVIVLEDVPISREALYDVLQSLGLIFVVRRPLPSHLRAVVKIKLGVYPSFLDFVQRHPETLGMIRQLKANEQETLSTWIRSKFSETPKELANVARSVPAWPFQQGANGTGLAALDDVNVTILPHRMPADVLRPFTDNAIMDWEESMNSVNIEPCTTERIVELLRVGASTVIRSTERAPYMKFIKSFLKIDKVSDHPLLVPNSNFTLQPASNLFDNTEPFISAFKPDSPHLLSPECLPFAHHLEKYGLKRHHHLDLSMFIECADALDKDRDRNKRARGQVLYRCFNDLRLSPGDALICHQLDSLKFIPRVDKQRPGYGNIDTTGYIVDHLPRGLLAPSQITIPSYEAICWSQKGRTDPPPNSTLRGTYQSLGKPDGSDVLAHLAVLAEIGEEHGHHPGLLSDIKATYKWLNEHIKDIADLMLQKRNDKLFLNVDDPESDSWVWHSASNLVIGVHDLHEMREVRNLLRNFGELLNAAGVRKVQRRSAKAITPTETMSLDIARERFNNMRQAGFGTDVIFEALDSQTQILPAHTVWLVANNSHFRTTFMASGMRESQVVDSTQLVKVERSSMCAKGVIDWFYVGKLPDFLTNNSNSNDEEALRRLELGLDMLSLCDQWEVTDLHQHLQVFIINDSGFINPFWVERIRQHAEATMAEQLRECCVKFEQENQSIIDDFASPRPVDDEL